uniref:GB1/RHD3-type G domain-containing protein n=1 Tax=Macrostomum lignano TaxID=282301 RepID=A0A1I8JD85_9PLAT
AKTMTTGEVVYLAELASGESESVERFKLNAGIERRILSSKRFLRSKVAVVSVAGAFRKGKSFLLNFFLRYLRALSRGDTRDWIRSDDQLDDEFHWRAGIERDTTGILIWSEPFFIRKPDGEAVAVLLMDTQGTFDHQNSTSIFVFSTLLSSVQIFNISQNIQETDLQHLRLFVEFASMAKDESEKVLQDLWFLRVVIRDWQNPDEFENGHAGGMRYLRKVVASDENMPAENPPRRHQEIFRMFCCLLPSPGKCATRSNVRGELEKLDEDFVEEVEKFVELVLSPEKLVIKAVNGRELTGRELLNFAKVYFEAFRSGRLPSPKSLFSATVELTNAVVAASARQTFVDKARPISASASAVDAIELEPQLQKLADESLEQFDKRCMQKDSTDCDKCRRKLHDDLQREVQDLILMNQLKSDKIAEQKKGELLQQDFQRLLDEKVDTNRRMQQLEQEFQEKVKRILESSVSKEEM